MTSQRIQEVVPFFGGRSDEGYVNKKNEDSWLAFKVNGQYADGRLGAAYVIIVADGVTSTSGGAQASKLAVNSIEERLKSQELPLDEIDIVRDRVHAAIRDANRDILDTSRHRPEYGNMSTTLVLALIAGDQLIVAHLGDSRAYLVRDHEIHRLTLDHTWGQEALDKQRISQAELNNHPNRNVIRRYLGINSNINIDWEIVRPGTFHQVLANRSLDLAITFRTNDVLLLCSDGLTDKVQEREILATIQPLLGEPQKAAEKLVDVALGKKEGDNITAALISFTQPQSEEKKGRSMGTVIGLLTLMLLSIFALFVIFGAPDNNGTSNEVGSGISNGISGTPADANDAITAQRSTETTEESTANSSAEFTSASETAEEVEPTLASISASSTERPIEETVTEPTTSAPPLPEPTSTRLPATQTVTPTTPVIALATKPTRNTAESSDTVGATRTISETITPGTSEITLPSNEPTTTSIATERPATVDTNEPTPTAPALVTQGASTPTRRATQTPNPTATPTITRAIATIGTANPTTAPPNASSNQAPTSNVSTAEPSLPIDPSWRVKLVTPVGDTTSSDPVRFVWDANFSLGENQAFELIFWKPSEEPMVGGLGLAGSGPETEATVRPKVAAENSVSNMDLHWGVRLVEVEPYRPIQFLGGGDRIVRFEIGGGESDSNPSGDPRPSCTGAACRD
ncbi:MAG: protein phosphatase 2C domain-containing protein [Chloroflexota bacterium]